MIKILPSTNPSKEDRLVDYVKELSDLGVEYIHCDVMDGKFVANSCLPFDLVKDIRNNVNILLDVHLMVEDPMKYAKTFATIKPSIITIHYESDKLSKIKKIFKFLKSKDILCGLSLKPNTPIDVILPLINQLDLVLLMSVEPGKSGQTFIENTYEKIAQVKELINEKDIVLEVDGGVNLENIDKLKKLGVQFAVVGSAIFNSDDKKDFLIKCDKHYDTK